MPKKYEHVKVVKIPLKRSPPERPQVFPRMPLLYLELIENKAKIKQDLINKEYIPSNLDYLPNSPDKYFNSSSSHKKYHKSKEDKSKEDKSSRVDSDEDLNINEVPSLTKSLKNTKDFEKRLDKLLSDKDTDTNSTVSSLDINDKKNSKYIKKSNKKSGEKKENDDIDDDIDDDNDDDIIKKKDDVKKNVDNETKDDKKDDESLDSDALSTRLKELLNDDSNSDSDISFSKFKSTERSKGQSSSNKYSRHRDKDGHSVSQYKNDSVPTLAELEKSGGYIPRKELRDINQVTRNEQYDEDTKRELLFKFDLLRKSYPGSNIPEYTIHTDLTTLQKSYDDCVRRLSLDSTVENYKTYLVYGFMGCEFVFGNFLGFDMQGFTQQQILSMNSYEKLLIELGEKSYVPTGSKWPVELRLLFMIIMNAAFFVISKMLMKKTGANLMGMINGMKGTPQQNSAGAPIRKRKMKGPNIDIGDIPDVGSPTPSNA